MGLLCSLAGCTVYGGVAVHPTGADCPEYCGSNPLGHFGARAEVAPGMALFVDHISSIPDFEQGYGLNRVGVQVEYSFK